ncbi:MAG: TolC family protein, partial [Terriglobales bacterium]
PQTPVAPVAPAGVPPQLRVQADAVAAAQSHQQEIARSALPRTYALGSAYGRGSGVLAAGQLAPGAAGLAPATAGNWALGVGVDFSITGWHANRAARAQAAAQFAQQQARQKQVAAALAAAQQKAAADWTAAQTVAQESPIGLAAARAGEAQARVRYQTGLASLVELANAEQLLAQADSDDALSRLQVWRALIETAFVAGSLQPLLQAAGAH